MLVAVSVRGVRGSGRRRRRRGGRSCRSSRRRHIYLQSKQ